ncbi:MAG: hypothetical protein J6034_09880 [Bacteroidaceae bacterium]|nr:hypothetical protein [Bacteroidaceae bacterium]
MNNREIQLPAIPVDFVLQQGEKEHTEAKRRPYSTLIRTWAEHEGKAEVGEKIANKLNLGKESEKLKDLRNLPNSVGAKYRKGDKAYQLVMTIREIENKIQNDDNWTWALVMKVMLDEGLIIANVPNKFDGLICSMIPGKGRDTVRKNGDFKIINDERHWRNWIDDTHINWREAANKEICEEIYKALEPVIY